MQKELEILFSSSGSILPSGLRFLSLTKEDWEGLKRDDKVSDKEVFDLNWDRDQQQDIAAQM